MPDMTGAAPSLTAQLAPSTPPLTATRSRGLVAWLTAIGGSRALTDYR